jgi:uncharacterized protein (DUF1810 family)
MSDDYNLHRFLDAQAPIYDTVLAELRAGRKSSLSAWGGVVVPALLSALKRLLFQDIES